jgi:hypothetical protein
MVVPWFFVGHRVLPRKHYNARRQMGSAKAAAHMHQSEAASDLGAAPKTTAHERCLQSHSALHCWPGQQIWCSTHMAGMGLDFESCGTMSCA